MATAVSSSNYIWNRSTTTIADKQDIIKTLVDENSVDFIRAFNEQLISNNFSPSNEQKESISSNIKKLLQNRGFNTAVTESMALLLICHISKISYNAEDSIIDTNAETPKIDLNKLEAYLCLLTNIDGINIKAILSYAKKLKLAKDEYDESKINFNSKNYNTRLITPIRTNIETLEITPAFIDKYSNTKRLIEAQSTQKIKTGEFAGILKESHSKIIGDTTNTTAILIGSHSTNESLRNDFKNKAKNDKKDLNQIVTETYSEKLKVPKEPSPFYSTHLGDFIRNQDSLPSAANKIKLDSSPNTSPLTTNVSDASNSTDGSDTPIDMNLPVNVYQLIKKEPETNTKRVLNTFAGSIFNSDENINKARATKLYDSLNINDNQQKSFVLDFRLLASFWDKKIYQRHTQAMEDAKPKNVDYIPVHAHFTAGAPTHSGTSLSNKSNNQERINYIGNMNEELKKQIENKFTSDDNQKNFYLSMLQRLYQLLQAPNMNATQLLLAHTFATILAEQFDSIKIIVGCKSAKDRTTAEFITMQALRAVIMKEHNEKKAVDINSSLISNLLTSARDDNKISKSCFTPEQEQTFFDNFDDKMLYIANHQNSGIYTNINVKTMQYILKDFNYHRKIKSVYSKVSIGS